MQRFNIIIILLCSILWAQDRDVILFPHQFHVEEEELTCDECHNGIELSADVNEHAFLPLKDKCAECHEDAIDEDCTLCHTNEDDPQSYPDFIKRDGPVFSHNFHLENFTDCFQCHKNIETDEAEDSRIIWTDQDCKSCHTNTMPKNHDISWIELHGMDLSPAADDACYLCHTENSCDQCHQLQQYAPKTHPTDYLLGHGFDVKLGTKDCSTCHQLDDDCMSCHVDQQVMPMDHNYPDWATETGGLHKDSAIMDIEFCQVCHTPEDPTCYRCHQ